MICELSAVKELWCISAKHGATQNRIYGFSGSLSTPYKDEESPTLCIFVVKATGSGKEVGYVFNSGSDEAHSWRRIGDYIGGEFARQSIQNHKNMMDAGLVCDHLTENRSNNYSWALAMVPNNFNATFGERAAIAKPYLYRHIENPQNSPDFASVKVQK